MRRLRRIQCKQKSLIRIIFHFFFVFFLTLNGFISMPWIWNPISSCQRVGLYVNKHNINVRFYFLCICAKQKIKIRPFSDVYMHFRPRLVVLVWFAYVPVSNIFLPLPRVMCSFAIIIFRPLSSRGICT